MFVPAIAASDFIDHPIFILENDLVFKPDYLYPETLKKPGPFLIVNVRKGIEMRLAVELDTEPF